MGARDSKPVRVRLILGTTELLSGTDTIRNLDISVLSGRGQFKVGLSEWEMMTFSDNRHLVFLLVATSCAYTKLNDYFGKLQNSKIEVLEAQGDFGGDLSARNFLRAKTNDCKGKWEVQNR